MQNTPHQLEMHHTHLGYTHYTLCLSSKYNAKHAAPAGPAFRARLAGGGAVLGCLDPPLPAVGGGTYDVKRDGTKIRIGMRSSLIAFFERSAVL
jgi:hypothetical protein